jgi:hypothetical protein
VRKGAAAGAERFHPHRGAGRVALEAVVQPLHETVEEAHGRGLEGFGEVHVVRAVRLEEPQPAGVQLALVVTAARRDGLVLEGFQREHGHVDAVCVARQVEGLHVLVAQGMRHRQMHAGVGFLGCQVLLDLLQAVRVAFFPGDLRDQFAPERTEHQPEGREEARRRHAAGRDGVAVVRQHHARDDGAQVRRPVLRRRDLGRTAVRRAHHAHVAVGPRLRRGELDGLRAVLAELRPDVFEPAVRAAGACRVDAHHRVSGLHEPPVELDRHGRLVPEVGRPADGAGVVAVEGQDHGKPARARRKESAVAQPRSFLGRDIARDAPRPERRDASQVGKCERARHRKASVGVRLRLLGIRAQWRRHGSREGQCGGDDSVHGLCRRAMVHGGASALGGRAGLRA